MLLRDLRKGEDTELMAAQAVIAHLAPDILLLTDFDYDYDGLALAALAEQLDYPHTFARRPNTGMQTDLDLDGNGRFGEARDAQGYGRFSGDGGMAILSRYAIAPDDVMDLSDVLWRDVKGAVLPTTMTSDVAAVQRLSTSGHWIVPVATPAGLVTLLAYAATPPVFDGPEDRNGLRNRDELRLWTHVLDGVFGPPPNSFVIAGNANLDPDAGDGLRGAMRDFLADPRLQDPLPAIPTAYWPDLPELGELRVSYVLPSHDWQVVDAGVAAPAPDDPSRVDRALGAGPHWLVWVDIAR